MFGLAEFHDRDQEFFRRFFELTSIWFEPDYLTEKQANTSKGALQSEDFQSKKRDDRQITPFVNMGEHFGKID
ncbi:hypothetical protein [Ferrimonas sp. YFM]|uniref:hypothetical protein n=1 Tax=Ferrimonas sp. YFM TaxID=3028878 RepID=UPI0025725077|nr:hypothetical protein [Ferrimonas sp. YFM]